MKSRYTALSVVLAAALMTLGACSRTDVARQAPAEESRPDAVADPATTQAQGTQEPGGDPAMQQEQQPMRAGDAVIQDNQAHPIDPTSLPTPSNSSQLPRPDLTQGGTASGSPVSETPATVPNRGQGIQVPGGRPPSETPAGSPMENGADTRKSSVEGALRGKPGLEKVVVSIGSDGCVTLDGTVRTEQKKEEATAIARGASGMGCVVNRVRVG